MLLNDEEIQERIESPLNLLNRLKTSLGKTINPSSLPSIPFSIPSLPPKSEDLINDLEDKISKTSTRSKAVGILNAAMDELGKRIPEVQKPEKLAQIAAEMSKVVSNQDNKNQGDKQLAQIIVYAPQVQNIDNYQIVDIAE